MVKAYVQLYADFSGGRRWSNGRPNISSTDWLNTARAIQHVHSGGRIISTIFKVDMNTIDIDNIVASGSLSKRVDSDSSMQINGLYDCSGTATNTEIDALVSRLSSQVSMTLSDYTHSGSSKDWVIYLKEDTSSIGEGYWQCTADGHIGSKKVLVSIKSSQCNLGHSQYSSSALPHIPPFDITKWI